MHTHPALRLPWRILVGTTGTLIVLIGFVFFVTPGPGIASVLLGLFILSTEFRWAHRLMRPARVWARWAERRGKQLKDKYARRRRARRRAKRGLPPDPRNGAA